MGNMLGFIKIVNSLCLCIIALMFSTVLQAKEMVEAQQDWFYQLGYAETLEDVCQEQVDLPLRQCVKRIKAYNHIKQQALKQGTQLQIPVKWLKEVVVGVKVQAAFGEVYYKSEGDKQWKPLKDKQRFVVKDMLRTAKGNLRLEFHDGSLVEVGEDTELQFNELQIGGLGTGKVRLSLKKGRIKSRVQKRQQDHFEIRTPAGVAAVRGTDFRVRHVPEENNMFSEVLGGSVAMGLGDDAGDRAESVTIERDYGVKASPQQGLSAPQRLLEPPQADIENPHGSYRIIRVQWQPLDLAVAYEYELYQGQQLLQKKRQTQTNLSLSLVKPGNYFVLLRGVDKQGFIGKDARVNFSLTDPLAANK